jgi:hypothetical protein
MPQSHRDAALPTRRRPLRLSLAQSPARLGQIVLGLLWCIDGLLKLQPYLAAHFADGVIEPNAAGQPGLLGDPITWIGHLVAPHQALFAVLAAVTEFGIGVGLLVPRTVKPALLVSFAWALGVWYTGEGLGGLFTDATPSPLTGIIATSPLYIVAGLLVWPTEGRLGLLRERGARLAWAALWLGAAVLWLFPSNSAADALHDAFAGAPAGAGWLAGLQSDAASAAAGSGATIALLLAAVSAAIGLAVLFSRGTRIALYASMALSVAFWFLAEGLGGLFTGSATDVGTAPLMLLIAAQLLVLAPRRQPAVERPLVGTATAA